MPYTRRQIRRILDEDGLPVIALGRSDNLALRVTESYLRRKLYAWEDRAVGQQWDLFNAALTDIRSAAALMAEQLQIEKFERTRFTLQWKREVMNVARTLLQRVMNATAFEGYRRSLTAYYVGYYGGAWQLEMLTGERASVPAPDNQQLHADVLLGRLQEAVLPDQTLYDLVGADFRQRHQDELAEMLVKINRALDTGLNNGEGFTTIFRRVRTAMGVQTDRRQGFTKNFHAVQSITRTAIMTSSNQGNLRVYEQNADVVSHVEWLASRDNRVCPICQSLDGTRWPLGDRAAKVPPGDSHPNCRCTIIPVVDLNIPNDQPPPLTWQEWLQSMGLYFLFDDFITGQLASTQV